MAVIRIQAQKDARCMQAVCQIHGDRRTQILRFDVNRFDGGVDLGGLRWVIKTTNALGKEDIFDPEAVEIKERTIAVDWLVDGSVTDASGITSYELNGIDTTDEGQPVQWSGGLGSVSVRAGKGPKFGETDGMTNIEKLILYVEGELQSVIDAGDAAAAAAETANRAAANIEDLSGSVERANAAAQRATEAAEAVEDLEGAVNRANAAAASVNMAAMNAEIAANNAYAQAARAKEAADAVENITEAVTAAHEAAEAANNAAATANEAALPHAVIYGMRVIGETAKASGNPATFLPDAGSLLMPVTVLEPQQEGSGDPYPAGGGKNLLNYEAWKKVTTERGNAVWENNGVTITATSDDAYTNVEELAIVKVTPGDTITFSWEADSNLSGMAYIFPNNTTAGMVNADNAATKYLTYSVGEGVTFIGFRLGVTNAGDTIRYKNVQIEKGSTPTAFQPSSNIRSFIGYDKLDLTAAGKNLLKFPEVADKTLSGVTWSCIGGEVTVKGTAEENVYTTSNAIGIVFRGPLPDGKYKISGYSSKVGVVACVFENGIRVYHENGEAFTIDENNVLEYVYCQVAKGYSDNITIHPMVVHAEETDLTFAPYQGKLHTVQIGQTVYGFRYEWLTGKGWITWMGHILTGTESCAVYGNDATGKGVSIPSILAQTTWRNAGMCSHDKVITSLSEKGVVLGNNNQMVYWLGILDTLGLSTADEFKTWLAAELAANRPVQFLEKLATPIEIQPLPPTIISAADPEQTNTLYGDGGIEVEYVKPLHVSIEERVAAAVAAAMNTEGE